MIDPKVPLAKDSVWLRAAAGWNRWTGASVNRGIFGAAVTIGLFTILAKIVAVAKDLVVARIFGTADAVDAFLIAFMLPSFAIAVISGSLNGALIPVFVRVRESGGPAAGQRLLSNLTFVSLALLVGITLLMFAASPAVLPLIGSGFTADKQSLTRSLYFLLLPTLVIYGLSTTWSAVLNADNRFALAALAPGITPAITIAAMVALGYRWGIFSLAAGTLAGFVLEAAFLGRALKRHGFNLLPRWYGFDAPTREVTGQFAPLAAGALLMGSSPVIDQSMAAMLGPGSVATLGYGNKVVALILGIGSLALSTAVLPYFSRMVASADWVGVRHTLRTYLRFILIATFVVMGVVVLFAEPMIRFLFQRGSFTARDTQLVSVVTACFALQIPFFLAGTLGVRLLNALRMGRSTMVICSANLVANVLGNLVLMRWMGVAGIALSTSFVYLVSCAQILYVIRTELNKRHPPANHHG